MKIYACDDEQISLKILEKAIQQAKPDAEISLFNLPANVLDAVKENPCDVVFLDIQMPGMNGIDLAKKLMEYKPDLNIIFVTGFDNYAIDAYKLYASGYVLKPVDFNEVAKQLNNLRYAVSDENNKKVFAKTFGNFTLFVNNQPVYFHLTKAKEMFAYLVDRNGSVVSRQYLSSILFEDEDYTRLVQKRISAIVSDLEKTLKDAGIEHVFLRNPAGYAVDKTHLSSDLFDYLDGKNIEAYRGEYMEEYSWGEDFKASQDY